MAGGTGWIKAVSAALPMLRLNPTSGVDLDNAGEYLKNGAASVGLVAPLFDPVPLRLGLGGTIIALAVALALHTE